MAANLSASLLHVANGSESLEYPFSPVIRAADMLTVILMILLGITGNALLILSYVNMKTSRSSADIFVMNMVIADLLVTIALFPMLGNIIQQQNILPPGLCQLFGYILVLGCVASVYSLCMVALCRMCCICYTAKAALFSTKRCLGYCVLVWLFAITMSLPPYVGWGEFGYSNKLLHCSSDYTQSLSFTLFFYIIVEGNALTITFACYAKIFRTIQSSASKMAAHVSSALQSENKKRAKSRQRQAFCSFVISAMFVMLWGPFCITTIVDYYTNVSPHVVKIATWLGLSNSSVNGFVYIMINRHYRNACLRVCPCVKIGITPVDEESMSASNTQRTAVVKQAWTAPPIVEEADTET